MRVPEGSVYIHLFRQNPVFTSLHLKSPVHVVPPRGSVYAASLLAPVGNARFLLVAQERLQRPGRGWDDPDPVGRL
jgi:hypothetical protein